MEIKTKDNTLRCNLWLQNPLVILCLCFALGILLSLYVAFHFVIILAITISLLVLAIILHIKGRSSLVTLLMLFLLCGALHGQLSIPTWYRESSSPPSEMSISGSIHEITRIGTNSITCIIDDVKDEEDEYIDGKVELIIFGSDGAYLTYEYPVGYRVAMTTRLTLPSVRQHYGWYDERLALMRQGVRYQAVVHHGKVRLEGLDDQPKPSLVQRLRQSLREKIENTIGGQEGALLVALITADKSQLDYESKEPFYDLGLAHVLATSGLHIGLLLLLIQRLCKRHRIGFIIQVVLSLILVTVFIMIAGLRSSLSRAAIMWLAVILARVLGRQSNGLNALALAVMVILAVNPMTILDTGFILSVSSVLALITLYDPISQPFQKVIHKKWVKPFLAPFVASIVVYIFGWAIMAYYFNQVNIIAPIWNAFIIPFMTLLLGLGFIFIAVCYVPVVSTIVAYIIKWVASAILWCVRGLHGVNVNLICPSPRPWIILLAVLGALLLSTKILAGRKRIRTTVALGMILASIVGLMVIASPREEVLIYSDLNKTAVFVSSQGERAIIVNEASRGIDAILEKQGSKRLDALIFTGNKIDELQALIEDSKALGDYRLYIHSELYDSLGELQLDYMVPLVDDESIQIGDVTISLQTFKAKSKTAKHNYAAMIYAWGQTLCYLDPLRLRGGMFNDMDIMVASRWSESRLENIIAVNPSTLVLDDGSDLGYGMLSALEDRGVTHYNINRDGAITLSPEGVQPYRKQVNEEQ